MDAETMEATRNIIEYLKSTERKHYEETPAAERHDHIYLDVCKLEKYLDGDTYEFEHVEADCEREDCSNEAVRWYEEGNTTVFVCLEHEDVAVAEENDGMIKTADGKVVEMGVYSCSEDCHVCNN